MKLANLGFYARRPLSLVAKMRMDLYARRHPGEPWLAPGAIRFCAARLTTAMSGLEWGSGRSTVWFARRLGSLVSVEHDANWHAEVTRRLASEGLDNVDLRLVSLPSDPGELNALLWKNSPYVAVAEEFADDSLDFVVVDGLFRQECVARVLPKVKPGGFVLVDDTRHLARIEEWGFPAGWQIVVRDRVLVAETTIWQKPA